MYIVGVSCSPRVDGNTQRLVTAVAKAAANAGGGTFQVFALHHSLRLVRCDGCDACHQAGAGCHIEDDLTPVLERMCAADAIVIGCPVYNGVGTAEFGVLAGRTNVLLDIEADSSRLSGKIGAAVAVGQMGQSEQVEGGGQDYVLAGIRALLLSHDMRLAELEAGFGVSASTGGSTELSAVESADPEALIACRDVGKEIVRRLERRK